MPAFKEIKPYCGVSTWNGTPFMAVPLKSANLIKLEGASPRDLSYDKGRLEVRAVTSKNQLDIAKILHEAIKPELKAALASLRTGEHLLAVKGLKFRETPLKAVKGKAVGVVNVGVFEPKSYTLAFKFLRHGPDTKTTKFKIADADGWLTKLNAIYGLQANVSFTMGEKAADIDITPAIPQPVSDTPFLNQIVPKKSKDAQLTIFMVGKWKGNDSHANGTFFSNENVAVIDDEPMHPKLDPATEPVLLTIAHEIAHFVLTQRGFKSGEHHNGRDRILLSKDIQSVRIDKQLALNLNSY